jgi:hypothetical protein
VNVIELVPLSRLSDDELQIRQWEAMMAGGYGCAEYRQLESELSRRMSGRDSQGPRSVH